MYLNPLSGSLLALLVLVVLWMLTRRSLLLVAVVAVVAVLWLLATPFVSRGLQSPLESRAATGPVTALPQADVIVVLGGALSPPSSPRGDANLSAAADRLVHATRLYERGKAPLILISGGHAGAGGRMDAESVHAAALLSDWGVPESAILTETESTTTYENAVYSKRLLERHRLDRVLLVTSALHMPRALATFRSAGIDAVPSATDFATLTAPASGLENWIAEPAALEGTTRALKEYLGWLFYRRRGWITNER